MQNGVTPLHLAAKYGHKELVRQLCIAGCDVNAVNKNDQTADQVAGAASHGSLAALIRHLRKVRVQLVLPIFADRCEGHASKLVSKNVFDRSELDIYDKRPFTISIAKSECTVNIPYKVCSLQYVSCS